MKAMIFAAGLGTRLKEHTADKPKALVRLAGKPLIEHAIEYLMKFGINDITINVYHFADQIISFINENRAFGANIHISDERDKLLDTGGGLKYATPFLKGNEPILIYNVDIISNIDINELLQYHESTNALITLAVRQRNTKRYLMFGPDNQLSGWKNVDTGKTIISRQDIFEQSKPLAYSGIHIISPKIFELISEEGTFPVFDLYLRLAKNHRVIAFLDQSDVWMDLGKPEQLSAAETAFEKFAR